MPSPNGVSNNPNGRGKGVPNKVNREVREILMRVCQSTIDNLDNLLEEIVMPKDRIDALSKLMPYFVSKMPNVNVNATAEKPESIQPPNVTFVSVDMSNNDSTT